MRYVEPYHHCKVTPAYRNVVTENMTEPPCTACKTEESTHHSCDGCSRSSNHQLCDGCYEQSVEAALEKASFKARALYDLADAGPMGDAQYHPSCYSSCMWDGGSGYDRIGASRLAFGCTPRKSSVLLLLHLALLTRPFLHAQARSDPSTSRARPSFSSMRARASTSRARTAQ